MSAPEKVTVRVRAVKRGSYNGLREPGTKTAEFDFETTLDADGKPKLGSWMQLATEPEPAKPAEPVAPRTLSEASKANPESAHDIPQGARTLDANDLV
jgi:hypothetical protein